MATNFEAFEATLKANIDIGDALDQIDKLNDALDDLIGKMDDLGKSTGKAGNLGKILGLDDFSVSIKKSLSYIESVAVAFSNVMEITKTGTPGIRIFWDGMYNGAQKAKEETDKVSTAYVAMFSAINRTISSMRNKAGGTEIGFANQGELKDFQSKMTLIYEDAILNSKKIDDVFSETVRRIAEQVTATRSSLTVTKEESASLYSMLASQALGKLSLETEQMGQVAKQMGVYLKASMEATGSTLSEELPKTLDIAIAKFDELRGSSEDVADDIAKHFKWLSDELVGHSIFTDMINLMVQGVYTVPKAVHDSNKTVEKEYNDLKDRIERQIKYIGAATESMTIGTRDNVSFVDEEGMEKFLEKAAELKVIMDGIARLDPDENDYTTRYTEELDKARKIAGEISNQLHAEHSARVQLITDALKQNEVEMADLDAAKEEDSDVVEINNRKVSYTKEMNRLLAEQAQLRTKLTNLRDIPSTNLIDDIEKLKAFNEVNRKLSDAAEKEKGLPTLQRAADAAGKAVETAGRRVDEMREKFDIASKSVAEARNRVQVTSRAYNVATTSKEQATALQDRKAALEDLKKAEEKLASISDLLGKAQENLARKSEQATNANQALSKAAEEAHLAQQEVRRIVDQSNISFEEAAQKIREMSRVQSDSGDAAAEFARKQMQAEADAIDSATKEASARRKAHQDELRRIDDEETRRSVKEKYATIYANEVRIREIAKDTQEADRAAVNKSLEAFRQAMAKREEAIKNVAKQEAALAIATQKATDKEKDVSLTSGDAQIKAIRDAADAYDVVQERAGKLKIANDLLAVAETKVATTATTAKNALVQSASSTGNLNVATARLSSTTENATEAARLDAEVLKLKDASLSKLIEAAKLYSIETQASTNATKAEAEALKAADEATIAYNKSRSLSGDKDAAVESARTAAIDKSATKIKAMQDSTLVETKDFFRSVDEINDGFSLMFAKGGNVFLGLRQALFGTTESTNILSRTLDDLGGSSNRLVDDMNRFAASAQRTTEYGQNLSNALNSQVSSIKDIGKNFGFSRESLSKFDQQVNKVQGQWTRLASVIESKGAPTKQQIGIINSAIRDAAATLSFFEAAAKKTEGLPPEFSKSLKEARSNLNSLMTMAANATANMRAYEASEKKAAAAARENSSSTEKQASIFSRIAGIFKSSSDATKDMASSVNKLDTAMSDTPSKVNAVNSSLAKSIAVSAATKAAFSGLTYVLLGGGGFYFALNKIGDVLRNTFGNMSDANVVAQDFGISIKTMMRGQDELVGYETQISTNLINYIKEVGKKTPFELAELFQVVPRMIAQGINIKEWLQPMANVAAVMNKSVDDVMNALQRLVAGDTGEALQSFRTMGVNMNNVAGYFNKATGEMLSFDEATKAAEKSTSQLASEGIEKLTLEFKGGSLKTSTEDAVKIFNAYFKQSSIFYEAAEERSRSFTGAISNLKDTITGLAITVGQPILKVLTDSINALLGNLEALSLHLQSVGTSIGDSLSGPIQSVIGFFSDLFDSTTSVGDVIARFVAYISSLLSGDFQNAWAIAYQAIKDFVSNAIDYLKGFLPQAASWGYNFIVQIANGIIDAVNGVLYDTLVDVGNMIADFLEPGSPPRVGPLSTIDEWGAALMEVFGASIGDVKDLGGGILGLADDMRDIFEASGFTAGEGFIAAFSQMDLGDALNSIRNATSQMNTMVSQSIAGLTGDVFKGLKSADFSAINDMLGPIQDFFKKTLGKRGLEPFKAVQSEVMQIVSSMNTTGTIDENAFARINALLGEQGVELSDLLRKELQLSAIRKKSTQDVLDAKKKVTSLQQQIADAEAAGQDTTDLRLQLQLAKRDLKLKEDAASADNEQVTAIEEEVNWRKAMLAFQEQSKKLQEEYLGTTKTVARAESEASKERKESGETAAQMYEREKKLIEDKYKAGALSEKEYVQDMITLEERYVEASNKEGISAGLDEHMAKIKTLKARLEELKDVTGTSLRGMKTPSIGELLGDFKGEAKKAAIEFVSGFGQGFTGAVSLQIPKLGRTIMGPALERSMRDVKNVFAPITDGFRNALVNPKVTSAISRILKSIESITKSIVKLYLYVRSLMQNGILNFIQGAIKTAVTFVDNVIKSISNNLGGAENIATSISNLIDKIADAAENAAIHFDEFVNLIIGGDFNGAWEKAKQIFNDLKPIIDDISKAVVKVIKATAKAIWDNLPTAFTERVTAVVNALSEAITTGDWSKVGDAVWGGVKAAWDYMTNIAIPFLSKAVYDIGMFLWGLLPQSLRDQISEIVGTVTGFFTGLWETIESAITDNIQNSKIGESLSYMFEQAMPSLRVLGYIAVALAGAIIGVGVAVVEATASVLPYLSGIISGIARAVGGVFQMINGIVKIFGEVLNGLYIIFDAIIRVLQGEDIERVSQDAKAKLDVVWQGILNGLSTLWSGIKNTYAGLIQTILSLGGGLLSFATTAVAVIVKFAATALAKFGIISGKSEEVAKTITDFLSSIPGKISDFVRDATDKLYEIVNNLDTILSDFFKMIYDFFANLFSGGGGDNRSLETVGAGVGTGFNVMATEWIDQALKGITDTWTNTVLPWLNTNLFSIPASMGLQISDWYNAAVAWIQNVLNGISTKWGEVSSWLYTNVFGIPTLMGNQVTSWYNAAVAWIQNVLDGFTNRWEQVKTWMSTNLLGVGTSMGAKAVEIYNAATNWIQNVLDGISTKWADVTKWLDENIFNLPTKFYDMGKGILDSLAKGITDAMANLTGEGGALATLMSYFPHSPAKKGPLSNTIDWTTYFFGGIDAALTALANKVSTGISNVWASIFGGGTQDDTQAGQQKFDELQGAAATASTAMQGTMLGAFYTIEAEWQVVKNTIILGMQLLTTTWASENMLMTTAWSLENSLRTINFDLMKSSLILKFGEMKNQWNVTTAVMTSDFNLFKDAVIKACDDMKKAFDEVIQKLKDIATEAGNTKTAIDPLDTVDMSNLKTELDTIKDKLEDIEDAAKDAYKWLQKVGEAQPPSQPTTTTPPPFTGIGMATGAWRIPQTMPAILHAGETVLPAGIAESWRRLMSSLMTTDIGSMSLSGISTTVPTESIEYGQGKTVVLSPVFNTTINDGMDVALFESRVMNVMQRGLSVA